MATLSGNKTAEPLLQSQSSSLTHLRPYDATSRASSVQADLSSRRRSSSQMDTVLSSQEFPPASKGANSTARTVLNSRFEPQPADIPLMSREDSKQSRDSFRPSASPSQKQFSPIQLTELRVPSMKRMEFLVPLGLPSRVRDQYFNTLNQHRHTIQTAIRARHLDEITIRSVEQVLARLDNVSTHLDLDNDTTLPPLTGPANDECTWAVSCSTKFQFLRALIERLRKLPMHLALLTSSSRLCDILERFVIGHRVDYRRADRSNQSPMARNALHVTLVCTTASHPSRISETAQVLCCFDPQVDIDQPYIRALRGDQGDMRRISPVIHPMVYCSAHHIGLCLPPGMAPADRLRALVECISQTHTEVGDLAPDEHKAEAAAEEVAAFVLAGGHDQDWTLMQMRPIKLLGVTVTAPFENGFAESEMSTRSDETPSHKKRLAEEMNDGLNSHKRFRLSSGPDGGNTSEASLESLSVRMTELESALASRDAAMRKAEESHSLKLEEVRQRLQSALEQKQACLDAIETLQGRYERLRRAHSDLRQERQDAAEELQRREVRAERLTATIADLKDKNRGLEEELAEARSRLSASNVPDVAALEQRDAELRTLRSEKAALERRLASMERDYEFTRQQYQTASTAAAEATARLGELETAAEQTAKSAIGSAQAATTRARTEVQRQEQDRMMLDSLRVEVEALKEQLTARHRNRGGGMMTRTGSQAPRSPRPTGAALATSSAGATAAAAAAGGNSPVRSRAGSRAPPSRTASPARTTYDRSRKRGQL